MNQPNFYIPHADYQELVGKGEWNINEIDLSSAQRIRGHFGISSSFAMFASGVLVRPEDVCPDAVLAGIDWIRHENNLKPGEEKRPLNVYHYIVGSETARGYPVYYCGHSGSLASAWSTLDDLNVYLATTGSNQPVS